MFCMDVVKVDRDVAYVVMGVCTYVANLCSQCFICFLFVYCKCVYLDVAYISHICCKYFI